MATSSSDDCVNFVDVPGGSLEVHHLGSGSATVVALHGITANGVTFGPLADRLNRIASVLAPDLRGRAGSAAVVEPAGLSAHADDVIALLDSAALDDVVLVGHSMGAYVAAVVAARHPARFRRVILVDGGIAFPPPPGTDIDAVLTATIGPAMDRLSMTFESPAAYLDFWRPHPAMGQLLAGPSGAAIEAYLLHDLVSDGAGAYRSSCALDVIRADGGGVLTDPEVHAAISAAAIAGVPITLLWAERGMLDQTPGLLPPAAIAAANLPDPVDVRFVANCNHYSILLDSPGLDAVVEAVTAAL